ncbi:hypothetical protein NQ176_g966 [Zarea fungicola]|uniref:Uncharacterized protein n=1 Tax=Zarea fungicola TaxID=93591 RepID=A0ACC1NX54_9HYPO|nr:hypothetical protein NQ176_g966 [Lecanicillium fungicola]
MTSFDDVLPSNDDFLFVNITNPTGGHHRGASEQKKIRQHAMRKTANAQRKRPRNPWFALKMVTTAGRPSLAEKTNNMETICTAIIDRDAMERLQPKSQALCQHPLAVLQCGGNLSEFRSYEMALTVAWNSNLNGKLQLLYSGPTSSRNRD